jgi:hypothetical protein
VPRRRDGWWGIAFLVLLTLQASMVSVPTAEDSGGHIQAFYLAHGTVIVIAQAIGALALIPFVMFARALDRRARTSSGGGRSWIMPAIVLIVIVQLVTNVVPVLIVTMNDATAATARSWTRVEDVADAILFAGIAFFVIAATRAQPRWILAVGWVSAALLLVHAAVSLFGESALQVVAPLSFVASVLLLSIRMLVQSMPEPEQNVS